MAVSEKAKGPGRHGRPRSRRRLVFLVLAQVVATLAFVEFALRFARRHFQGLDRLLYLPTISTSYDRVETLEELLDLSILGYRPYSTYAGYVLNSRSLRTPEYEREKRPGTFRVVVLGDSFAFGSGGVPFGLHWPHLLERELDRRLPEDVEVVNLGASGVGPGFYYRMWQIEGSRLDADLVVLTFFIGNDVTDEEGLIASPLTGGGAVDRLARLSLTVRAGRALYRLRDLEGTGSDPGGEATRDARSSSAGAAAAAPLGGYEILAYREEYETLGTALSPEMLEARTKSYEARTAARMRLCLKRNHAALRQRLGEIFVTLRAIDREVAGSGSELVVVVVPDEYQVNPELRSGVFEHTGKRPRDYALRSPQDVMLDLCEASGIECLDLLPEFERSSGETVLYRPRNTHWNREGNALATRLLVEHLVATGRAGPVPGTRPPSGASDGADAR